MATSVNPEQHSWLPVRITFMHAFTASTLRGFARPGEQPVNQVRSLPHLCHCIIQSVPDNPCLEIGGESG